MPLEEAPTKSRMYSLPLNFSMLGGLHLRSVKRVGLFWQLDLHLPLRVAQCVLECLHPLTQFAQFVLTAQAEQSTIGLLLQFTILYIYTSTITSVHIIQVLLQRELLQAPMLRLISWLASFAPSVLCCPLLPRLRIRAFHTRSFTPRA